MSVTRSKSIKMEETLKQLMEMMQDMKKSQEDMKKSQEDMKKGQEDMKKGQEDMKIEMQRGQEDMKTEMKIGQEEMKKSQENMKRSQEEMKKYQEEMKKNQEEIMKKCQEEMKAELKSNQEFMKNKFESFEQVVEEEILSIKSEVQTKTRIVEEHVAEVEARMKEEISEVNKEIKKLEEKIRQTPSSGMVKSESSATSSKIKPPPFDGKVSWSTYQKQFEAAALVNCWSEEEKVTSLIVALRGEALEILRSIPEDKQRDYTALCAALELRYGEVHLQHVYQAQLKGRKQRYEESLQQFEAEVARMVNLAYPTAPSDFKEQLAVSSFIDGIRDTEISQALRLARHRNVSEALAQALEIEAAKQASRGATGRIRQVRAERQNQRIDDNAEDMIKIIRDLVMKQKSATEEGRRRHLCCWSCGAKGHLRSRCPRNVDPSQDRRKVNCNEANSSTFQGRSPILCWKCGAEGHPRSRCSKYADQNQDQGKRQLAGFEGRKLVRCFQAPSSTYHRELSDDRKLLDESQREKALLEEEVKRLLDENKKLKADLEIKNKNLAKNKQANAEVKKAVATARDLERQLEEERIRYDEELMLLKKELQELREQDKFTCRRLRLQGPEDWDTEILVKEQNEDPILGPILKWKSENRRPDWQEISDKSPTLKSYWALWDSLTTENGLLKRVWESPDGKEKNYQTILPRKRVPEALKAAHNGVGGGHFGINKTLNKVRERFYWLGSRWDVEEWCRKCEICATSKGPMTRSRGQMRQYNVGAPFERIAVDVAGPFPRSRAGNRYILVAMDYFSKWPELYAIPNQEATTVAETLFANWICRYGVPREIHSDQGRNFESEVFQKVCQLLGMTKTRTTPLHPQSDGMVERFNRTIETFLKTVVNEKQDDWDTCLPPFLLAYRSAVHESTGKTPANIIFGNDLRLPIDIIANRPESQEAADDYLSNLKERMAVVHEEVRKRLKIESDRMKTRYDLRANSSGFHVGEKVLLYNPKRTKGRSPKLEKSWEGPYVIVTRLNDVVYRIQKNPHSKMKIVHLDRLTRFRGRDEDGVT